MAELCREGSPPQVRGKLRIILRVGFLDGITPAGAGKTFITTCSGMMTKDHPRRCGENAYQLHIQVSPPRITPAGAGKTQVMQRALTLVRDHPRRCGENAAGCRIIISICGSPPQVRGKPSAILAVAISTRITPAGAGKTEIFLHSDNSDEDHPRRCGENPYVYTQHCRESGSPPQVRGKHALKMHLLGTRRITPAGAGKTFLPDAGEKTIRDHPRRCGENHKYPLVGYLDPGSPPQVRGKPPFRRRFCSQNRITPAGAGKTTLIFPSVGRR